MMNAKRGEATRQRILDSGLDLVSREGFGGVSIGRLAKRTELSKSGLFAHFGSRETLQLALLEHANELAGEALAPALSAAEGLPRLKSYFEHLLGWAERSGLPGGCPFVSASFEFDDTEGPVRDYVATSLSHLASMLETFILEAVALGQLSKTVNAKHLAWQLLGIYTSHHTLQRLMRDPDADLIAKEGFEKLLKPYENQKL